MMRHALGLARRGLGNVWPNPAVGCVIVKDGRVVGRGWTQPGGRPHAEAMALAQAGPLAAGAEAYVTLEPCAHHGRTPPCAEALVRAGIVRVVSALGDPDPRVAGRGHAMLEAAGIAVLQGVMAEEAARLQQGFLCRVVQGRPMVTLKLASTLDGRIATASGQSRWITGAQARRRVHAMRLAHDGVLVGAGTVRADDPMLDVRGFGAVRQPLRIVAARKGIAPESRLVRSARQSPLWVLHGAQMSETQRTDLEVAGARCLEVETGSGGEGIAPGAMMARLAAEGLTRVFCEGGGQLAASLLGAGCVDRMAGFVAGKIIGAEGRAGIGPMGLGDLGAAPGFVLAHVERCGEDVLAQWDRAPG
ncbi:bifunctional diaminohydroxyphosphoribosylaminopyrimidine deaminase/5-amino-6-(5-phosphoribosylamino)uracil reductase RibD [Profundibacterium mesophilum]|nr:bifunctional diaminohydroxyphosphoribosylaminopyrimidine deaminase/5-amino-6-(5-phosphoribosylamino)uracil reductase RibD [Profundibacterium mesophilum]